MGSWQLFNSNSPVNEVNYNSHTWRRLEKLSECLWCLVNTHRAFPGTPDPSVFGHMPYVHCTHFSFFSYFFSAMKHQTAKKRITTIFHRLVKAKTSGKNRWTCVSVPCDRRPEKRSSLRVSYARFCTKGITRMSCPNPHNIPANKFINRNIISILGLKELRIREIYQFSQS